MIPEKFKSINIKVILFKTIYIKAGSEISEPALMYIVLNNITLIFMDLNFSGIIIGIATFLVIGLFHPLVIKAEYYIGVKSWWLFLLLGIVSAVASLLVENLTLSILLGVVAFSSFWSIGEVFEQKKRVEKGWFPANPKKKK
jgi:hypothetical protein